jgi:hypothetical protein
MSIGRSKQLQPVESRLHLFHEAGGEAFSRIRIDSPGSLRHHNFGPIGSFGTASILINIDWPPINWQA